MLLLPYFSKLIEARHYNDMAARYVAFEKTVWLEQGPENYQASGAGALAIKQTSAIASEIPERFFSKVDYAINSRMRPEDELWNIKDHGYVTFQFNQSKKLTNKELLAAYNPNDDKKDHTYFEVDSTNKEAPGTIAGITNNALAILEIGGTDFNDKSFYKGQSEIQIASHLLLEDEVYRNEMSDVEGRETKRKSEFEIVMKSELHLLADGWNVGGPRHNINQVKGMVPSSLFDFNLLNQFRNLLTAIPLSKKLGSDSLKFGHVDIEELPQERYRTDNASN